MACVRTNLPLLKHNMTLNYVSDIFLFVTDAGIFPGKNFSPYCRHMTQLQSAKEDVSCEHINEFTEGRNGRKPKFGSGQD